MKVNILFLYNVVCKSEVACVFAKALTRPSKQVKVAIEAVNVNKYLTPILISSSFQTKTRSGGKEHNGEIKFI